ncbi:chemotaxis protein CheW [Methylobacterium sp. J-076]|uniref:chemotaxis protein CheW n=1 Tax=Methylobacterium sp. J-076 TaxID=2836655 RepID=UPI001FBB1DA7|nr:chemotaxis protein CheW [Methylobacterium sp. J-076]MCJ2013283.1 chemotaxis protein CheW [Methylobacterium sp. J-076]
MAGDPRAYLILDVAGTACALPREAVAEVLPLPELQRAPASGGWLAGFVNLAGRPVPVLDLAPFLGLRQGAAEVGLYAHLVLARDLSLAWLVDRASDLVNVPAAAHRPADPAASLNGCVAAGLLLGDRLVPALDPARLLTQAERARIEGQAREAAARLAALPDPPPA